MPSGNHERDPERGLSSRTSKEKLRLPFRNSTGQFCGTARFQRASKTAIGSIGPPTCGCPRQPPVTTAERQRVATQTSRQIANRASTLPCPMIADEPEQAMGANQAASTIAFLPSANNSRMTAHTSQDHDLGFEDSGVCRWRGAVGGRCDRRVCLPSSFCLSLRWRGQSEEMPLAPQYNSDLPTGTLVQTQPPLASPSP